MNKSIALSHKLLESEYPHLRPGLVAINIGTFIQDRACFRFESAIDPTTTPLFMIDYIADYMIGPRNMKIATDGDWYQELRFHGYYNRPGSALFIAVDYGLDNIPSKTTVACWIERFVSAQLDAGARCYL